jgi:hypothetical protein
MGLVQIIFGVVIIVHNVYAASLFNISLPKVQNLESINGCSDAFTQVKADMYAQIIANEVSRM